MPEHMMASGDTLKDVFRDDGTEETVVTFTEGGTPLTVTSTSPEIAAAAHEIKDAGYLSDLGVEVIIEYEGETLTAIAYQQTVP